MRVHRGVERRAADVVGDVDVDAGLDQRARDIELAVHQRQHERGMALGIDHR